MATLMLPIEVTLIPNVHTIRSLGWLNSYPGLAGPFLATALGTFLLRQGFRGIPRDLLDASRLDGFGHLAFLRRVALPVTRPTVAAFAVVSFLAAWNQYTWPRAVVTEGDWETLQIGLKTLSNSSAEHSNVALRRGPARGPTRLPRADPSATPPRARTHGRCREGLTWCAAPARRTRRNRMTRPRIWLVTVGVVVVALVDGVQRLGQTTIGPPGP